MNRKLSKKAYMNGLEKSSTVVIMQAKNIKTLNITCVCEKKATKKKKIEWTVTKTIEKNNQKISSHNSSTVSHNYEHITPFHSGLWDLQNKISQ